TYYGGTDYDYAYSTTTDFFGNVYLAGFAKSSGLATSGAHQTTLSGTLGDAFLAKYDNAGVMQWATYYGGTNLEIGYSVAVTDAGDVYLTGFTNSTAGIASTGAYDVTYGGAGLRDAFLAKFNSSGARQWGTYYGGAGNDEGYSLGLASDGSVYLAGTTSSTADIATTGTYNGGTSDAFLVKFTSAGTRTWGIYYGGAGADEYNGMSIDRVDNNNVYLSGCTNSTSGIAMGGSPWQPTLGGGTDAFVAKFDPTGTNMWGTYFGGTGDDCGFATAIDKAGDIYMVGRTASNTGISTTNARAGLEDGFIAKFVNTGNRTWGRYFGGPAKDEGYFVAVDGTNGVYVSGYTESSTGINSSGITGFTAYSGAGDAMAAKFDNAGTPVWSTYYGGTGAEYGYGIAVDGKGDVYLAGQLASSITMTGGADNTYGGGGGDAFLSKVDESSCPIFTAAPANVTVTSESTCTSCMLSGGVITAPTGTPCPYGSTLQYAVSTDGGTTYGTWTSTAPTYDQTNAISVKTRCNCDFDNTLSSSESTPVATVPGVCTPPTPSVSAAEGSGNAPNDGIICSGDQVTLNASGGVSYAWDNGSAGPSIMVSPTATTTYTVTATAANGCTASATSTVTVNPLPTPMITVNEMSGNTPNDGSICSGASFTLTASTSPASYVWNTTPNQTTQTTTALTPTVTTTYSVTVTDPNSCASSTSTTVTVNALPTPSIVVTDMSGSTPNDGTICSGASATMTASGGTSYSWNTGEAVAAITKSPITTTSYTVTVTNADGCTATSSSTITVKALPTASISVAETSGSTNNDGTICTGASATLTASGGGTYKWSTTPEQTTPAITVSPIADATYTVTVTNADGCTSTTSTTITVKALPTASISVAETSGSTNNDGTICTGASATLTASGGGTYKWSTTPQQTTAAITVSPIVNTTYTVTVTNADGCTATSSSTITVKALPTPSIAVTDMSGNTNNDGTICSGASATMTASGGTGYAWSSGESVAAITKSPITTTTYTVTVTNADGCSSTTATTITVNPLPMPTITVTETSVTNNDGTICNGASVTLTSSSASSYVWSTTPTQSTQTTTALSPIVTTTYTVTVTDANNCQSNTSTTITVNALPTASITVAETSGTTNDDGTICTGASATLTATEAGPGGSYAWSSVLGSNATGSVSPIVTTTYTVTVTNADGCTATASTTITVKPLPIPAITVAETSGTANNDGTICNGASVTLTATGGGTYNWSSDLSTNASGSVSPTMTTTYTVTVTSADGCTATASTTITVNNLPTAVITETDMSGGANDDGVICGGGTASLTASGGTSYLWNNGTAAALNSVSPLVETTYTVTVTDANGCVDTESYTVSVSADATISLDCVTPTTVVNESFDTYMSGSPLNSEANWDDYGMNSTPAITSARFTSASNAVIFGPTEATQSAPLVNLTTGKVVVSANVRPDRLCSGVFAVLDNTGTPVLSVKANAVTTDSTFSLLDHGFMPVATVATVGYTPDTWYEIEYVLDLDNDSYVVKIDGVTFASATGFTQDFGGVALANEAGSVSSFYVDDVSAVGTVSTGCDNQTVCLNTAITTITYTTTEATGATVTGLPA
ncbi:MAG: beta strand repeat-containing protein, partial [Bacteroidota bacterium]